MKISKGKVDVDGKVLPDIAIPAFGYKSHISIDVRHGFIRRQIVTDAAAYDDARLREGLIDRTIMSERMPGSRTCGHASSTSSGIKRIG